MTNPDELWNRVHRIIDERRDPLDDPEICTALLDNPEYLEEVASLRARIDLLAVIRGGEPPVSGIRRRPAMRIALVAASLLVSISLLVVWTQTGGNLDAERNIAHSNSAGSAMTGEITGTHESSSGVILDFEVHIIESGPGYENTFLATGEGWISREKRTLNRADINGTEVITRETRYGTIDAGLLSSEPDDPSRNTLEPLQ